jgi:hypothetical protein
MKNIRIKDIEEIGIILDYVHDQYFEMDEIKHDKFSGTISIPIPTYSRESKAVKRILFINIWEYPNFQSVLVFHHVSDLEISDRAEIGTADINIIVQENDWLIIKCGIPVDIKMRVESICIELIISDEIVSSRKGFDFSFRSKLGTIESH